LIRSCFSWFGRKDDVATAPDDYPIKKIVKKQRPLDLATEHLLIRCRGILTEVVIGKYAYQIDPHDKVVRYCQSHYIEKFYMGPPPFVKLNKSYVEPYCHFVDNFEKIKGEVEKEAVKNILEAEKREKEYAIKAERERNQIEHCDKRLMEKLG
jgi:hypothetical protein